MLAEIFEVYVEDLFSFWTDIEWFTIQLLRSVRASTSSLELKSNELHSEVPIDTRFILLKDIP